MSASTEPRGTEAQGFGLVHPDIWLESVVDSAEDVAGVTLGTGSFRRETYQSDTLPEGLAGAFIDLDIEVPGRPDHHVKLGVIAAPTGCRAIAGALLMAAPDEDLSECDVADSVGEFVNIVAGGVKSRMGDKFTSVKLGIPGFHSRATDVTGKKFAVTRIAMDEIQASVIVIHQRP